MKKLIGLIVMVGFLVADPARVRADDSDIFGQAVQPNVLILLDSSGSMADEIPSESYNPATTYTVLNNCSIGFTSGQPCTSAVVYKRYFFFWWTQYTVDIASVSSSTARDALSTVGFWSGSISGTSYVLQVGNYRNYLLSPSLQQQPKIDIAKEVLTDLVSSVEGVRFGLMKFNSSANGGTIVSEVGTAAAPLVAAINAVTVSGGTPTGEQLRDAGDYYKGTFGYSSPIQLDCQPNFIILVSDGDWNGSIDPAAQGTLRFTEDHATALAFPGTQNVFVHTVGFGGGLSSAGLTSLQNTATNGGGNYYAADTSAELQTALQDAISQIIAATFTFASPVIPTTSTSGSSKVYLAAFQTDAVKPFWRGYLKAYNRDSDGEIPTDDDGVPLDSALAWEAGTQLNSIAASARTVYTVISGTRADFLKTNASLTAGLLSVASDTIRDKVIDFTRGIDSYDEDVDGNTTEERAWKLGDIFHANPVLVSPPFLPLTDSSYQTFKTTNSGRTAVVIAGANDGMLHAFQESNGNELWAFIPPGVLNRLEDLTDNSAPHNFFVDSSPIVADIQISGTWKTIAVFGQRRGGNYYYALDITRTPNTIYLWSFSDPKLWAP